MVACLMINTSRVENKTRSEENNFYSLFILDSYLHVTSMNRWSDFYDKRSNTCIVHFDETGDEKIKDHRLNYLTYELNEKD